MNMQARAFGATRELAEFIRKLEKGEVRHLAETAHLLTNFCSSIVSVCFLKNTTFRSEMTIASSRNNSSELLAFSQSES